jgi:2-polyprenyl-6-methoxyphenol hydroxylase-like FAD-dependent oxidoreductase
VRLVSSPFRRSILHFHPPFSVGVAAGVAVQPGLFEQCRWLVGCNGAHSKSAPPSASIFAGGQYPQTFVLADLEVDRDLLRDRMYRFNAGTAGQSGGTTLAAVPVHGSLAATACPPSCRNPL